MKASERIAYGSIGWVTWALCEVAAKLAPLGVRGIEGFGLNELMPEDEHLAAELAGLGMQFVGSYFGASLVQKDRWETEMANLTTTVKKVAELGGTVVAVRGGRDYRGLNTERSGEHWKSLIEGANQFGKIAAEHGVKLAFHPHDHTLIYKRENIVRFLSETDSAVVGITFDTAHFACAGMEIVRELETLRRRVLHVHLKDVKDGEFVELGMGGLPLREFLISLLGGGYEGWMTIELDATQNPEESAKKSVAYLQRLLSSIGR